VLSNNLVKGDDGAYGAIRVGSPKQGTNLNTPNHNVQLTHNRIVLSGGTNLVLVQPGVDALAITAIPQPGIGALSISETIVRMRPSQTSRCELTLGI